MQPMTVEQSLKIIEDATAAFRGTRQEHMAIAHAIETVKAALNPQPVELKTGE